MKKAGAMKAMKMASAMKMKMAMKAKKVSIFGKKSKGGLKKDDLTKNKAGKIVSKKKAALGKKNKWTQATAKARKALGLKGFIAVGGKSAQGQALLKKARSFYKA